MTGKQELHLQSILRQSKELLRDKYRKGAEEHSGDLLDLSKEELLDEAINEAIDQLVYLLTLKEKL